MVDNDGGSDHGRGDGHDDRGHNNQGVPRITGTDQESATDMSSHEPAFIPRLLDHYFSLLRVERTSGTTAASLQLWQNLLDELDQFPGLEALNPQFRSDVEQMVRHLGGGEDLSPPSED